MVEIIHKVHQDLQTFYSLGFYHKKAPFPYVDSFLAMLHNVPELWYHHHTEDGGKMFLRFEHTDDPDELIARVQDTYDRWAEYWYNKTGGKEKHEYRHPFSYMSQDDMPELGYRVLSNPFSVPERHRAAWKEELSWYVLENPDSIFYSITEYEGGIQVVCTDSKLSSSEIFQDLVQHYKKWIAPRGSGENMTTDSLDGIVRKITEANTELANVGIALLAIGNAGFIRIPRPGGSVAVSLDDQLRADINAALDSRLERQKTKVQGLALDLSDVSNDG